MSRASPRPPHNLGWLRKRTSPRYWRYHDPYSASWSATWCTYRPMRGAHQEAAQARRSARGNKPCRPRPVPRSFVMQGQIHVLRPSATYPPKPPTSTTTGTTTTVAEENRSENTQIPCPPPFRRHGCGCLGSVPHSLRRLPPLQRRGNAHHHCIHRRLLSSWSSDLTETSAANSRAFTVCRCRDRAKDNLAFNSL